ncbi:MAG: DNA double-strand break repair nuclease NurA [Desulfurococcales archaeon]|nr:DNA double-strand break repair nuclease NurA [Desulfurococcales archaeon]
MTGNLTLPRSLAEAVLTKRDLILRIVQRIASTRKQEELLEQGERELRELPIPQAGNPPGGVGSEDGGSSTIDMEAYTVYMVKAWAGSWLLGGDRKYRNLADHSAADVGVIIGFTRGSEARVRFYRETLEAYTASRAVEAMGGGVFLWDGSLRPLLLWPWGKELKRKASNRAVEMAPRLLGGRGRSIDAVYEQVKDLYSRRPLLLALELASRLVEEEEKLDGETWEWLAYLEWLEKLTALKDFLERAWERGVETVFVSKTTRSQFLFRKPLPDVFYLNLITRGSETYKTFYTRPRIWRGASQVANREHEPKERFLTGDPGELKAFYEGRLGVLELYARISPGKPILKVDIAFDLKQWNPKSAEEAEEKAVEVLEGLSLLSGETGYPFPLLRAHRNARIGWEGKEAVIRALGLGLERRSRSMLEI